MKTREGGDQNYWDRIVGLMSGCFYPYQHSKVSAQQNDSIKSFSEEDNKNMYSSPPRVVLFMDINQTIIMMDPVQNKSLDQIVCEIISDTAWGHVTYGEWKWNGEELSHRHHVNHDFFTKGSRIDSFDSRDDTTRCMTYSDYLACEDFHYEPLTKQQRNELRRGFVTEGGPGEGLMEEFQGLRERLRLPSDLVGCKAAVEAGLVGESVHLIPAFFHLVLHLKQHRRDFNVIFRTFGEDISSVVKEYNHFCEGRHPQHPGVSLDGRDGRQDMRVAMDDPLSFGCFFREEGCCHLVMGTTKALVNEHANLRANGLETYNSMPDTTVFSGMDAIHDHLRESVRTRGGLALRDDHHFWHHIKGGACASGKFMPVDLSARGMANIHPIFFDDNIKEARANIVDVRRHGDWATVPFKEAQELVLVPARPLNALRSRLFYVEELERLEEAWGKRREKQQKGPTSLPPAETSGDGEVRAAVPVVSSSIITTMAGKPSPPEGSLGLSSIAAIETSGTPPSPSKTGRKPIRRVPSSSTAVTRPAPEKTPVPPPSSSTSALLLQRSAVAPAPASPVAPSGGLAPRSIAERLQRRRGSGAPRSTARTGIALPDDDDGSTSSQITISGNVSAKPGETKSDIVSVKVNGEEIDRAVTAGLVEEVRKSSARSLRSRRPTTREALLHQGPKKDGDIGSSDEDKSSIKSPSDMARRSPRSNLRMCRTPVLDGGEYGLLDSMPELQRGWELPKPTTEKLRFDEFSTTTGDDLMIALAGDVIGSPEVSPDLLKTLHGP